MNALYRIAFRLRAIRIDMLRAKRAYHVDRFPRPGSMC